MKKPGEPVPPQPVAEIAIPQRIGRYRVERVLGKGGFGLVYLAQDEQLSRRVAVKVPHARLISGPADAELYLAEARTVANLDHPHIVPVYDVGGTPEFPCYIVSKYVDGFDLAGKIKTSRLGHSSAAELVATIAEALHYAHRQGLVHRDVKPGNILIDDDGRPYLVDFGLALRDQDLGQGPRFAGTPAYMSPEQARGEGHRVDGRSDIFSLGVVFYELLVSRRPFVARSQSELLEQVSSLEVRPPRQIDDTIPKELERICLKALSKRAADRYTTAKDLAEDLRHFLSEAPAQQRLHSQISNGGPASETIIPGDTPPAAPDSDTRPIRIVPKGLRSFDRHDADFFLELLPGPRDRDGLPDSLRFWKSRIEETDPDQTFSVGLIYGPSGCGKSSLVKAGLLPRLSQNVIPIYLEATADDTETRLLYSLRKACPSLAGKPDLPATLGALRHGQGLPLGKKVLIVLDQFEQWLHAKKQRLNTELVQALRQCDGGRVQCIVMVRDDFWLAVSRFLRDLEIRLVEGENSALADLFDVDHAKKVLAAFGRAFGKLPEVGGGESPDQQEFLNQAVSGLAQEGKVICVRLALFAEMMKGKLWTPATLLEVGGAAGVGVTFLEETFSASTAPPEHRYHQQAARAVLQALLPESGADIKGHMRSYQELLAASGYGSRPRDYDDLVRILDSEIRLVTPTDPEGKEEIKDEGGRMKDEKDNTSDSSFIPPPSSFRYYQLTHDYLVPSLRDWLTRKQKETRCGRAELRLAERSTTWNAKPENRHLPLLWEYLNIIALAPRKNWTEPQRKLMVNAGKMHGIRGGLMVVLAVLVIAAGFFIKGRVEDYQTSRIAQARVEFLLAANTADVEKLIKELENYGAWAKPLLREIARDEHRSTKEKLHASLALVSDDSGQANYLFDHLLDATPDEIPVIHKFLAPHKQVISERLWNVAKKGSRSQQIRVAACLAVYAPDDARWKQVAPDVAEALVSVPPAEMTLWIDLLAPVGTQLTSPLARRFRDPNLERDMERPLTLAALGNYFQNEPEKLVELALLSENSREFRPLLERLRPHQQAASVYLKRLMAKLPPETQLDGAAQAAARDAFLKSKATAAVCLLELGEQADVWPLLKHTPDPSLRSFVIERIVPLGGSFATLAARLYDGLESDAGIRQAVILALGDFDLGQRSTEERNDIVERLSAIYRDDPDSGIHSAAAWTLRRWHNGNVVARADAEFQNARRPSEETKQGWFVNSQGQTFLIVNGPVEFVTGDEGTSTGALKVERLEYRFAIATHEVTNEQYSRYVKNHKVSVNGAAPDAACPVIGVLWLNAAAYCNWLSEQEGLPREQRCYEPDSSGNYANGLTIPADFLKRKGYRLPTEAEWECVCRAGTATAYSFGEPQELLVRYSWYGQNSQFRTWPVGNMRPNQLGALDMHGNAWEWCQDSFGKRFTEGAVNASDNGRRVLRGGSWGNSADQVGSAAHTNYHLSGSNHYYGFRVARTYPIVAP